ncbi:MAG: glycosyltransferase family 2 protein [Patescibacteria group bacterium]|mgnify:FL=1
MKSPLSVIILTYNEEIHIGRLLENIAGFADEVFIVDSYSTDKTLEIAEKYGAKIIQHPFENQAQQFNWALDNLNIKNEWILRLDADEYLTPELKNEIADVLLNTETSDVSKIDGDVRTSDVQNINGFYIKRRVYFMGRWIKHGGYYPAWFLRLFKKGKARSEQRAMDEHIVLLDGKAEKLKNDFIDDNRKDLTWWIGKHNNYASREVEEVLKETRNKRQEINAGGISGQTARKRWMKDNFYYRLPLFFRAFWYFCHRYFFRLGFLDGKEGLIWHFLQGFWYRFLVDSKIYEMKRKSTKKNF